MLQLGWIEIEPIMAAYTAAWIAAVVVSFAHLIVNRRSYAAMYSGYWRFLLVPWKLLTFAASTIFITVVAPYTGDPTWDYVDAPMMAVLSFASAPWVLGVFYRWKRTPVSHLAVAACLWMLSASWCYDIYQLLLHGFYPLTWATNIVASSVLYISVGLVWNLDVRPVRGATFAFQENPWLVPPAREATWRILLWATPAGLLGIASIVYFLV